MKAMMMTTIMIMMIMTTRTMGLSLEIDTNGVYSPCEDAKVQRGDGFTFGIAFSSKESFFLDQSLQSPQLSPCDRRLDLPSKGAQLALFRPKVDELSLLTINRTTFDPVRCYILSLSYFELLSLQIY